MPEGWTLSAEGWPLGCVVVLCDFENRTITESDCSIPDSSTVSSGLWNLFYVLGLLLAWFNLQPF